MRFTAQKYANYIARRSGTGKLSFVQEQQDACKGQVDNQSEESEVDGTGDQFFRITIKLLVSDNRERDADGAISTILDCYTASIGRLLGLDRRALRKLATSEKRRRRLRDYH